MPKIQKNIVVHHFMRASICPKLPQITENDAQTIVVSYLKVKIDVLLHKQNFQAFLFQVLAVSFLEELEKG